MGNIKETKREKNKIKGDELKMLKHKIQIAMLSVEEAIEVIDKSELDKNKTPRHKLMLSYHELLDAYEECNK